ncbi:hypothetical protein ALO68_102116 [Pseudomonas syringae pv. helianthi]|uniref:Uncharacterized protein n=1 Tax=Pseudomonas syringae pv. helianthi TaxID=251654 RepID=A0A0P9WH22_9PSED|nr:hypothetical protein ALO68_102116 [Pseudomonas syringae pv. helianthi]
MTIKPTACILAHRNGLVKRAKIAPNEIGFFTPCHLQRLSLDLATHDPVEDHDQNGHADGDILKGLFSNSTTVLQVRQAQHDRQNAEGDQNRVNQTLLVGHNGFLNAHERAVCAACLRA